MIASLLLSLLPAAASEGNAAPLPGTTWQPGRVEAGAFVRALPPLLPPAPGDAAPLPGRMTELFLGPTAEPTPDSPFRERWRLSDPIRLDPDSTSLLRSDGRTIDTGLYVPDGGELGFDGVPYRVPGTNTWVYESYDGLTAERRIGFSNGWNVRVRTGPCW